MAERHTLRVRTIPKDTLDGRDDGGGNSESSSVSEEPADPKSHTPVRQTVYRTEAPPASQRNPMVDPNHQNRVGRLSFVLWIDWLGLCPRGVKERCSLRSRIGVPKTHRVVWFLWKPLDRFDDLLLAPEDVLVPNANDVESQSAQPSSATTVSLRCCGVRPTVNFDQKIPHGETNIDDEPPDNELTPDAAEIVETDYAPQTSLRPSRSQAELFGSRMQPLNVIRPESHCVLER